MGLCSVDSLRLASMWRVVFCVPRLMVRVISCVVVMVFFSRLVVCDSCIQPACWLCISMRYQRSKSSEAFECAARAGRVMRRRTRCRNICGGYFFIGGLLVVVRGIGCQAGIGKVGLVVVWGVIC